MILKSESKRERALLTIFPAAIVLAVYTFMFALPSQREARALNAELTQAGLNSVSSAAAQQSALTLRSEKETVVRMQNWLSDAKRKCNELCDNWRGAQTRLETLQQITRVMNDNNLSVLSQVAEFSLKTSTYQLDLLDSMNQHVPDSPIEIWNVEVKGAYSQVVNFLADIRQLEAMVVPVALSMNPDESGSTTWSIVLAI